MKKQQADELIERLLAKPEAYIPDRGFTSRVLIALPAPGLSYAFRMLIIAAFSAVAVAVGCFATPAGSYVVGAVMVAWESMARLQAPPATAMAVIGLVVWGAVAFVRQQLAETA